MSRRPAKPSLIRTVSDHRLELAGWALFAVVCCVLLGVSVILLLELL
jgi:hypothetical protein